jgi:probable phosphoglycerate mutase
VTTFLLIRHGLTDSIGHYLAGTAPGLHLNAAGRAQVEDLAWRLNRVPIAVVASSPLERAVETARPIARDRGLEIRLMPEVREVEVGR